MKALVRAHELALSYINAALFDVGAILSCPLATSTLCLAS